MFSKVGTLFRGPGAEAGGELSTARLTGSQTTLLWSHTLGEYVSFPSKTLGFKAAAQTHTSVRSFQVLQYTRNYLQGAETSRLAWVLQMLSNHFKIGVLIF